MLISTGWIYSIFIQNEMFQIILLVVPHALAVLSTALSLSRAQFPWLQSARTHLISEAGVFSELHEALPIATYTSKDDGVPRDYKKRITLACSSLEILSFGPGFAIGRVLLGIFLCLVWRQVSLSLSLPPSLIKGHGHMDLFHAL